MEISLAVSFYQCEWAQKSDIIYWTSFINIEEISTKNVTYYKTPPYVWWIYNALR